MQSLTIIHVEDEYSDFIGLTATLKTLIEDRWFNIGGKPVIASRSVLAESREKPPSWIAFQLTVKQQPEQTFRWIFVRDAKLPADIRSLMTGRIAFIFDVLRPDENGTTMSASLEETLQSIDGIEVQSRDVVVYTAYQGTGIDSISPDLLKMVGMRIRKENDFELDDFLSNLVFECLNDG